MNRISHAPNDADLILAYMQDENPNADLPDKLKAKLKMMEWAHSEIRQHKKPSKVSNMLVKQFHVSKSTALVVIREMELVFGSAQRKDKEYWRNIIVESIWEQIGKSIVDKDLKAAAQLYDRLIKALGLDRDNENENNKPLAPYALQQIIFMPQSLGFASPNGNTEKQLQDFLKQIGKQEPVEEIILPDESDHSGE